MAGLGFKCCATIGANSGDGKKSRASKASPNLQSGTFRRSSTELPDGSRFPSELAMMMNCWYFYLLCTIKAQMNKAFIAYCTDTSAVFLYLVLRFHSIFCYSSERYEICVHATPPNQHGGEFCYLYIADPLWHMLHCFTQHLFNNVLIY